jgi:DNA-binding NarL/FixJ family response regulator
MRHFVSPCISADGMTVGSERGVSELLAGKRAIRVLIVDDDPLFRLGVAAALAGDEQLEFILSEAGDGDAALALIASEEPAVVLLDLNMPRLDGHAVARLVKERWPQVRVIVLTGSDSAEDRRRAEQVGVDAFLEKRQLAETQLSAVIASV